MLKVLHLFVASVVLFLAAAIANAKGLDYGIEESFVNIHGLVTLEYFDFDKYGKNNGVSSFDQQAAYILFDTKIENSLRGIVELKLDRGGERVKIDRCFLNYDITNHWSFKGGKFYAPVLLDVKEYRPTNNKLITSPMVEIIDGDMFRDIGIEAKGDYKLGNIQYSLQAAIMNGLFRNKYDAATQSSIESSMDTNDDKAYATKLTIIPNSIFEISGSYMKGLTRMQIYQQSNSLVPGASLIAIGIPNVAPYNQELYSTSYQIVELGDVDAEIKGATLIAHDGRWDIRGWFTEGAITSKRSNMGRSSFVAYMGQASYKILQDKFIPSLELVYRRKHLEIDTSKLTVLAGGNEVWVQDSVGFNARLREHLNFKIEQTFVDDTTVPRTKSIRDNGILCQFMIDF